MPLISWLQFTSTVTFISSVEPGTVGKVPLVHPVARVSQCFFPGEDSASIVPAGGRNLGKTIGL